MKRSTFDQRNTVVLLAGLVLTSLLFGMPVSAVGEVAAWGNNEYGQCSDAPAGDGFEQVAVGYYHSLALTEDGTIAAWGRDDFEQCSGAPTGDGFTQVAAGLHHSLALREDGTIVAWGWDKHGQCSGAPAGNGFTQVAAGGIHSLVLTEDGTIVAWGNDWFGQCSKAPMENKFTQVAAGLIHNLALTEDGSIVAWGCDVFGDCNNAPAGTGFTQVAAGGIHSLALKEDRSIAAWGNDWFGQCNNEPTGDTFKQVDAGFVHSLALTSDGTIVAWGSDYFGQCSNAPAGDGFTQVAAGLNHNLELICTMFSPHASITAESSCDEGSKICFDASASLNTGDKTRYQWKFGDGETGSGATVEHMYTENGEYEVTLTVTNPYGLTDSATVPVIVSNVAPTIDSLIIQESASVRTPVEALAQFSDPGLDIHEASFNWGDPAGDDMVCIIDEQNRTISGSHAYTTQGEYVVTLTLTDDDGGSVAESTQIRVTRVRTLSETSEDTASNTDEPTATQTPTPTATQTPEPTTTQTPTPTATQTPEPTDPTNVPEFPTIAIPVMLIIGLAGVVLLAQRKQ
ncbi:PKD domain-containing protein [Methanogenium sp. MK-MG]|uniref:PKD domain-containing protein n=1 Tax=Methanogenium sp. MK-MG TaxID=2599926 RepID=UPI0013EADA11|nr:PKD domain-containing protein [Methanogenium sp. MK-MG]KAF1074806.1 hypothetical protein MKMG_01879 [Methanogenium sp. MK-MG]